jgi:hypothetical protein
MIKTGKNNKEYSKQSQQNNRNKSLPINNNPE